MKIAIKIIAYGIWFGFFVWLSIYSGGFLSKCVDFIEHKIIRAEILPDYESEIKFVLWNCFNCLALWIPLFFTRKKSSDVLKTIGRNITFLILLAGFMICGAINWEIIFQEDFNPSIFVTNSDAIKAGWSAWCVWWLITIVSNLLSAALTFSSWRPSGQKPIAPMA